MCEFGVGKWQAYVIGCLFLMFNLAQLLAGSIILNQQDVIVDDESIATDNSKACQWAIIFGAFGVAIDLLLFYGLVREIRAGCRWWWRLTAVAMMVQMYSAVCFSIPIYIVAMAQVSATVVYTIAVWVVMKVTSKFDDEGPLFRRPSYFRLEEVEEA